MATDITLTPGEQRIAFAALWMNQRPFNEALRRKLIASLNLITDHRFVAFRDNVTSCAVCRSRGQDNSIGKHVR